MLEFYCKDSGETLDYAVDFNRFLRGREYITAASAVIEAPVVTDPALTLQTHRVEYNANQVAVWLMGGENAVQYTVTVSIETSQGRKRDASFFIQTKGTTTEAAVVSIQDTTAVIGYAG